MIDGLPGDWLTSATVPVLGAPNDPTNLRPNEVLDPDSDEVFAKRTLIRICLEAGWPFRRWTDFGEIEDWLATTLDAWRADPGSLAPVPAGAPPPNGYFCGAEAWGAGRLQPPPGSWPPGSS